MQTGGQNVYRLAAAVTGTLQVNLNFLSSTYAGEAGLNLTILGADGKTVLTANPVGQATVLFPTPPNYGPYAYPALFPAVVASNPTASFSIPVTQGQVVLLQVSEIDDGGAAPIDVTSFSLQYTNLDEYEAVNAPGSQVQGLIDDTVETNTFNDYRLTVGVGGTLQATLTAGAGFDGKIRFKVLASDEATVLSAGYSSYVFAGQSTNLTVTGLTQGETIYIRVSGKSVLTDSMGNDEYAPYTVQLCEFDRDPATGVSTLFFPTVGDPSSIAAAALKPGGPVDLLVSNTDTADSLGVLVGTGKGTFWSQSQYDVGPGLAGGNLTAGSRQIAVANLTGNADPDVIVPNLRAGDVSVLLGNGNTTFQPQRIFNAVSSPGAAATGVFTSSGDTDAIVLENFAQSGAADFAFLQGNGDGTFQPPVLYATAFTQGATGMVVGDFTGNGLLDLIIYSKNVSEAQIFYGNGDGTFTNGGLFAIGENAFNAVAADLNGATYANGRPILDLVTAGTNLGDVYVQMGDPNHPGQFLPAVPYQVMAPAPGDNVGVNGLAVTDFNNGVLDIVATAQSRSGQGAAEVVLLPGNGDGTFGPAEVLATVGTAGPVVAAEFGNTDASGHPVMDLAVADKGGVTVVYGAPLTLTPITTPGAARNLGDAPHVTPPTQAIVTGHEDAYFKYTVPSEAAASGDEVIDFSALFQYTEGGGGLLMEITDPNGALLGAGDRFRVVVPQGEVLTIHIFGLPDAGGSLGYGTYSLDIDVLPQVFSVAAESVLPGGPATSLVLTIQGDALDPAAAGNAANYTVIANGNQIIPVFGGNGGRAVIYNPAANTAVASGLSYPDAARQTITLNFAAPLPPGSYEIMLSPNIQAESFSATEDKSLAGNGGEAGHPIVHVSSGAVVNGGFLMAQNLIAPGGTPGNPDAIHAGTPFLTQLPADLGALLNTLLAEEGDASNITSILNAEIAARFAPLFAASAGGTPPPLTVFWLDPVSFDLQAPRRGRPPTA